MNIDYIRIKNFKSIKDLKIYFNDKFNVLIGGNNAGKTTVLEAMLLWKKCYDVNIQKNKKKFYKDSRNISFEDLKFLRVVDDVDLFNKINKKSGSIEIEINFKDKDDHYRLGFEISKVTKIDNAYFQLKYIEYDEFAEFENLAEQYSKNLNNFIMFFETRPIYSITSKEPYMNKGQVLSKISKGKGHEVLRNKIIGYSTTKESRMRIEEHIYNITGERFEFTEREQGNREYIKLMVRKNGSTTDLLSQGSGFIQMAEIFSSREYVDANLSVLLIDEPDSHIHTKLQSNLLDEFRKIKDSQLFLISHNERFIDNVKDNEIIFLNENDKEKGIIQPLKEGYKTFAVEDLVGDLDTIEKLKYTKKVLIVEGHFDKKYIEQMCEKYIKIDKNISKNNCYIYPIGGIDNLEITLPSLVKAYNGIVSKDVSWILLRDKDFIPKDKECLYKEYMFKKGFMPRKKGEIILQDGYQIESTLFSDEKRLAEIICRNYKEIDALTVQTCVSLLNKQYLNQSRDATNYLYEVLEDNFEKQYAKRKEFAKNIKYRDFVKSIELQDIMTKTVIDIYFEDLHEELMRLCKVYAKKLTWESIMPLYIESIECIDDFYDFHLKLLDKVLDINKTYNVDLDFNVDTEKYNRGIVSKVTG